MLLDASHLALATNLGRALSARSLRVAAAESCTGGLVAAAITGIAGSSAWFERGFVTYSNEAKHAMLDVPTTMLEQFGAVSEPVAAAMARGARTHSLAQCALAVTGVAGPGGGTVAKPVGMVCFGWVVDGLREQVATFHFDGYRSTVRAESVTVALRGLLEMVERLPGANGRGQGVSGPLPDRSD